MSGGDFNDLLFEAEKLSSNIEGTNDLPKVDRSLRQVLEASNELYMRVTQTGAQDIQANLLLGSKGIDLPQIAQKLETITTKRTFEPLDPIADNDLNNFLKNELESCILSCIEQADKKTVNDIADRCWSDVKTYWKQEKRKILNAMIGPSGNFVDIRKSSDVFQTTDVKPTSNFNLTFEEQVYYSVIADYNKSVIRGSNRPPLVSLLSKAAEQFKDTKVNDMWDMVKYMLDLPPFPKGDDPIVYRDSKPVKQAMINQARKYLEERYKVYMANIVNENLMKARRGGLPGTYPLVRSFVGLRFSGGYLGLQDGEIDERPLWPMVYYCIRSGDLKAASACLHKAGPQFDDLASIIDDKLHNRSLKKKEQATRFLYRRNIRNSSDPYKRIVYCVLGCCDVNDEHTEVAKTTDDYLWLKLSQIRDEKDAEEHLNYSDLQTTILEEYGESHYEAHKQPHLYFQVLFLTGLFESAIEFLARTDRYRVHAVHIAVVINELFMLGNSSNVDAPLISVDVADPPPLRRINMARLIMIYVKRFELSNQLEALHYYFMLRHLKVNKKNLFMVSISDLAQETKSYDTLFGKIQPNGVRTPGLVNNFLMTNVSIEKLCEMIGKQLNKKGLYEEAVKLYDLADHQEEVLSILSMLLAQVVSQQTKPGSQRERLHTIAEDVARRYSSNGYKCTAPIVETFNMLREIMIFFDMFHSKQYMPAMELLRNTRLVPLNKFEVDDRVNNFKRLAPEVTQNLPDVLLAVMTILHEQYKHIKNTVGSKFEESTLKQLSYIRDQAKALTNFAGTIPYRMPGDINSRLVQMEILMH